MRQLSSRLVYENQWLSLREDQVARADGSQGIYSVVDAADFALVMPFENDGFHLVEQYRYPVGARSWEFPSGSFPQGVTGTPEELAAAELREETGLTAGNLERIGYLNPANAMSGLGCHVFLATDLAPGRPEREATEQDMRQEWFPRGEVERMLRDGVITDGPSIAAYLLLRLRS
ncbi:NUDIX domain-containing protein [Actinophytocola algeriensis]|uniref:8-oxo-dGTP pyrophosphatase MutT (NUDIX family) n=1 Tax=Actinophytocola algeriensis TaxID=1768010 RepID=A0A7W7PZN8_9PSEU|nr:NUDIX hydrolase [Actinophytocola algeriensis]MBB4904121.1 8-oxo-dGTP pyrophosphatase MutT (NUDIX family) [Actinophytocola algeriensis]MBE1477022.1 8-oxo-dGTP pyrophosphatase MutT (NUDIX family) [Actinophytocola algeriensis]